jgi:ABC-type branched-subunit amino acid transport system substrate-binding protein
MKKGWLILLLALCNSAQPLSAICEELRVGIILPLSGDFAPLGGAIRRGIESRRAQEKDSRVKVIYEDDRTFDRSSIVSAFQKLRAVDAVSAIFVTAAPSAEPLKAILEREPGPALISAWDLNARVFDPAHGCFSMGFSNEAAGEDLAVYARKTLKLKSVALLSAYDEWSETISRSFREKFQALEGRVLREDTVDLGTTDFHSILLRIRNSEAEGIVFPLYGTSIVSFIQQARQLKIQSTLVTGEGLLPEELRILGKNTKGVCRQRIPSHAVHGAPRTTTANPEYASFEAMGWDMMGVAQELAARTEGRDRAWTAIKETLLQLSYSGVTGTTVFAAPFDKPKRLEMVCDQ